MAVSRSSSKSSSSTSPSRQSRWARAKPVPPTKSASSPGAAAPEEARASTLYPKITGKLADLHAALLLQAQAQPATLTHPLRFTGTVKLHGTHADIVVHSDDTIVCQSRNRTALTLDQDNHGFAAFCTVREPQILRLTAKVRARWRELHPDLSYLSDGPVILAGEFIGKDIMHNVAVATLSRRWVLCSIYTAGEWERIESYADVDSQSDDLVNISKGGFYHFDYRIADEGAEFMVTAESWTKDVAGSCPFGRAMGVEGGGEGIVWTPSADCGLPNRPEFWLKTKAAEFFVSSRQPKVTLAESKDEKKARAAVFAAQVCTNARMEQGLEYLREMCVARDTKATGKFLAWLMGDIAAEEKREIDELNLGTSWRGEVGKIARPWYEKSVAEEGK